MTAPGGEDHSADTVNEPDSEEDPGWPISFLLLVGAGALYLILRLVQFVADVVG